MLFNFKRLLLSLLLLSTGMFLFAEKFDTLIQTIEYEDFDEFKRLMNSRFSVTDRDEWGFQPIHYAVGWDWTDDAQYIKYLFDLGTRVDTKVTNPTDEEYYEYENLTPLILAAKAGNTNAVRYLVERRGADVNFSAGSLTAMDYAAMEGGVEVVSYLHPKVRNKTGTGSMPYLNWAINHTNQAVALYLIDAGVDVNSKLDDFSALHHAVFGHSYDPLIMRRLVEAGAEINDTNRWSDTPLHYAAWSAPNATAYLLDHGALLNETNYDGNTPLIEAAIHGNIYSAQLLADAGADKSIRNGEGKTALDIARENNYAGIVDILSGRNRVAIPGLSLEDEIESGLVFTANMNGDMPLKKLDGGTVKLSDYRGKLVLLNIWATWCPPCRYEMPSMQEVYEQLKSRGFEILAVSIDESAEEAKQYVRDGGYTFPVFHDPMETEFGESNYAASGYPTTYIIDPNGLTVHESSGSRDWASQEYVDWLEAFLPAGSGDQSGGDRSDGGRDRSDGDRRSMP